MSELASSSNDGQLKSQRMILRLTGRQHAELYSHLFPGDGKEAVAVALCGRNSGPSFSWPQELNSQRKALSVYQIEKIPYTDCTLRSSNRVTWKTDRLVPILDQAAKQGMAVLKIHSHPTGYENFSSIDDEADRQLFDSINGWIGDDLPHVSAVMLPNGRTFARTVSALGEFKRVFLVSAAGDEMRFWYHDETHARNSNAMDEAGSTPGFSLRTQQAFGSGTVALLSRLSVAVVGASGTGSPTIEMLARLGIGELVIVDPDRVEDKNRSRILNTFPEHAERQDYKVEVLADAVRRMDLGTHVVPIAENLWNADVVRRVAQTDVLFGCMDSVDGRDLLNRLATYYSIPYMDVGVRLDSDGQGGVNQICGTVHYLQPDGSSLLSRGVYTMDALRSSILYRTEPQAYAEQLRAKYIHGVNEDRPAVISVNMLFAAFAVNEFLARLHNYRDEGNSEFSSFGMSLTQARLIHEGDGRPCKALARKAGRGDLRPLLDTPELSIRPSQST